jgi:DNA-binding NarL/FixJ family response regulator
VAEPLRLLLVEDKDEFREALELLLGLRSDGAVVGALADGARAAAACADLDPDVVVLDYRLPGLDATEVARSVLAACPGVAVVCLTGEVNAAEEEALREAGVAATLTKDERLDVIVDALHRAAGRAS